MANTKEVRKQISSIKSTRKITSALEMVAASKIKKTQDLMFGGRPYSEKVKEVIEHIASSSSEYSHPFYEDYDLWIRAIFSGLKFKNLDKQLVAMRVSNRSQRRIGIRLILMEFKLFLTFLEYSKFHAFLFFPILTPIISLMSLFL